MMSLEELTSEHYIDAIDAIRSCITLKEAKKIELGDYFPECIENDKIVITDFKITNLIPDLKHFKGIEPQEAFVFVGDYSYDVFKDKKCYYFITYAEFQKLCEKALGFLRIYKDIEEGSNK